MSADNRDYVEPRCDHGCLLSKICPYCDPPGFLFAYAKAQTLIQRLDWTDDELREMVQTTQVGRNGKDET